MDSNICETLLHKNGIGIVAKKENKKSTPPAEVSVMATISDGEHLIESRKLKQARREAGGVDLLHAI